MEGPPGKVSQRRRYYLLQRSRDIHAVVYRYYYIPRTSRDKAIQQIPDRIDKEQWRVVSPGGINLGAAFPQRA